MKKAIYLRLVLLTTVAIIIFGSISTFAFAEQTQKQTKDWLTKITLSAAEQYTASQNADDISKNIGRIRLTLIATDGTVIYDSAAKASKMENHAKRSEVKNAIKNNVYIDVRNSNTLGTSFMYTSIKLEDDTVLRLAYEYSGLWSSIAPMIPAVIAAMVGALILSMLLSGWLLRAVTKPLKEIQTALSEDNAEALKAYPSNDYEIYGLTQNIRLLWQKIADTNQNLIAESEKVGYLLSNMPEGFVLIDRQKRILLCNASAQQFFSCKRKIESESILSLTRDVNMGHAIDEALLHNKITVLELKPREGLVLRVSISPVDAGDTPINEPGATIMMADITAERQLEQQKQDFFSNASHELKTPITSILGFAEMLAGGVVESDDQKKDVAKTITKEAQRMSNTIADILTISDLESGALTQELSEFDFADVVQEVIGAVLPMSEDANILTIAELEAAPIYADKRRIHELCMNLIANAIKYNKPGGTVSVTVKSDGENAVFTVQDTGIGISEKYQQRVFERFFRVDSGRDKRIGGTGLGLSIVKHIVGLYEGKITLQSKLGEGTTITVSLPILTS